MLIRVLRNIGVQGHMLEAGDTIEVDAETAHYLIELRKLAVAVKPVERAVQAPAETAVSQAQASTMAGRKGKSKVV